MKDQPSRLCMVFACLLALLYIVFVIETGADRGSSVAIQMSSQVPGLPG